VQEGERDHNSNEEVEGLRRREENQ